MMPTWTRYYRLGHVGRWRSWYLWIKKLYERDNYKLSPSPIVDGLQVEAVCLFRLMCSPCVLGMLCEWLIALKVWRRPFHPVQTLIPWDDSTCLRELFCYLAHFLTAEYWSTLFLQGESSLEDGLGQERFLPALSYQVAINWACHVMYNLRAMSLCFICLNVHELNCMVRV